MNFEKLLKRKKIKLIIICRSKSKRFPGKITKKILGFTLLEILSLRLIKSFGKENILICTSEKEKTNILKKIAKNLDIKIFFGDDLNIFKRIIDASKKYNFKHLIRITGDNPLTDTDILKKMIKNYLNNKVDFMYTSSLFPGLKSEIISVNALKKCNTLCLDPNSSEYLTYFFLRKKIFKIKCFSEKRISNKEKKLSITIDQKKDFINLNNLIKNDVSNIYISKKNIIKKLKINKFRKKNLKKIPLKTKNYNVRLKVDPKTLRYINLKEFNL